MNAELGRRLIDTLIQGVAAASNSQRGSGATCKVVRLLRIRVIPSANQLAVAAHLPCLAFPSPLPPRPRAGISGIGSVYLSLVLVALEIRVDEGIYGATPCSKSGRTCATS